MQVQQHATSTSCKKLETDLMNESLLKSRNGNVQAFEGKRVLFNRGKI